MADPSETGFGLASFSSRGPTKDERIKPEIAAPGVNISSVKAGSTNQYVIYSGTSMATPFDRRTPHLALPLTLERIEHTPPNSSGGYSLFFSLKSTKERKGIQVNLW
jgi:subtilisin family serine protease